MLRADLPNRGSVWFDGQEVTHLPPDARCRRGIVRTFQIVRPLPNLTVLQNVAVGSSYGHVRAPSRLAAERQAAEVLDEWLAGLNPSEVVAALALVRRIRASGVTVVMVEHLVKAVFGVSDRVVVLSAGEKISEGTSEQVARDPRVVDAYLGAAHTEASAAISPRRSCCSRLACC
jgi:branched-chain amino acid transport system ATP-binding protein